MLKIRFSDDPRTKQFINELFQNETDPEGFIVNKEGRRVIDSDGQEITLEELGVIKDGSEIYVKKNFVSLVNFYQKFLQSKK